jgi:hypothetical protein
MNPIPTEAPLPCSFGTHGIIDPLVDAVTRTNGCVILVNLQTMIRNVLANEGASYETFSEDLGQDLRYFEQILLPNLAKHGHGRSHIVYYLFNYHAMLLGSQLRPTPPNRVDLLRATEAMLQRNSKTFGTGKSVVKDGVGIHAHTGVGPLPPGKSLHECVAKIGGVRTAFLISHQPIDWHVHLYLEKLTLVNSFTGELVEPRLFGTRAFGEAYNAVPFYPCTHILLGDKYLLAPILTPKQKKELNHIAQRDKWNQHSQEYVAQWIREHHRV